MHLNQNVFFAYCQEAIQFLKHTLALTPQTHNDAPPIDSPTPDSDSLGEVYYDDLTSSKDIFLATAACILAIPALLN